MTTSSPPAPREVTFELNPTLGEHLRAHRAAQRHGRGRQIRVQGLVGVLLGIPFGLWILYGRGGRLDGTDWLLVALVAAFFMSPLPTLLTVRRMRRAAAGPARVTLSERGLTTEDAHGGATLAWRSVRGVAETDEFLVFDLDDAGGYFVPLRVLRQAGVLEQARQIIARGRSAVHDPADAGESAAPASAEADEGVEVEFRTTLAEEFAARQQVWFRSRQGRQFTGYLIGMPLVLLALFRWAMGPQGVRDNLYLLVGGAALALLVIPGMGLLTLALGRAFARGAAAPVHMRVDDAGVTVFAGGNQATTAWPGIRTVQQAGGFLLFWTDRNTAHVLPVRALGAHAERARHIVRRHAGERAAL